MDSQEIDFAELMEKISRYQGSATSPTPSEDGCALCDGTGWIRHREGDYTSVEKCACRVAQEAERRIRYSGLSHVLDNWTMERFQAAQPWQQRMKETVLAYVEALKAGGNPWLYVGGAVGSGKSHLCTAACGELLRTRFSVRYMQWLTDARRLKSYANDAENYDEMIMKYLNTPVLYIDDLFKAKRGAKDALAPSDADVRLAFELINGRYAADRPLILTSEWMLTELMDVDEGTFSRVYEKTKGFRVEIKREPGRNYRTESA